MNHAELSIATMGSATPDHLTDFSVNGWALWRRFQVRATGFPSHMALSLSSPECGAAATVLADAETAEQHARAAVAKLVFEAVRSLIGYNNGKLAQRDEATLAALQAWRGVERALAKRHPPDKPPAAAESALSALAEAEARLSAARDDFANAWRDAADAIRTGVSRAAGDARFQEAVTWQSKQLFARVLQPLAAGRATSNQRRNEELVASYVQRYSVKNDTIGFFGPVAWGRWRETGHSICAPPMGALAHRQVYFEDWAIAAVGDRFAANPQLLPWLVPTRNPTARLEGRDLVLQGGVRTRLSHDLAWLFAACNGRDTASQIAVRALADGMASFESEAEVLTALQSLARGRRIHLGWGARLGDAWPERHLRNHILTVEDTALRDRCLAQIEALVDARDAVGAAAGDPPRLSAALTRLDELFEVASGASAHRNPGETYGARTIVFEDCRGAGEVELGHDVLEAMRPPLDLLLMSARWFCNRVSAVYDMAFAELYTTLRAEQGGGPVDLSRFWLCAQPLFEDERPAALEAVRGELIAKWADLIAPPPDVAEVRRSSGEITASAERIFAAQSAGWQAARHHSPDVMIAAASAEALERGDFTAVLGEIHVGLNTIVTNSVVNQQHPSESLLDLLHTDLAGPRISLVVSLAASCQPFRTRPRMDPRHDVELCSSFNAFPMNRDAAIEIADLVVVESPDGLRAVSPDGRSLVLLDVFGDRLSAYANAHFEILPRSSATPRILIDNMVVQRRSWRRTCEDLRHLCKGDEQAQYLAILRWARTLDMPVRMFVKVAWERKPLYLDLNSPIYVRMFLRIVRNALDRPSDAASLMTFSEMLPDHERLWMPFEGNARCTCEFRFVAIHRGDVGNGNADTGPVR